MGQEHKVGRSYHEALRRIGVENPGEVGIASPVQMEASVDDFSHLVAPIQVPVVGVGAFTAGAAATHSGMEILAGARTKGVWIEFVAERNGATAHCFITTVAPPTIVSAVVPLCGSGGPIQSIVNRIRIATPVPDGGLVLAGSDELPLRFFLEPGERFQIVHNTVNTNASYTIHFREVPTTGPVEQF